VSGQASGKVTNFKTYTSQTKFAPQAIGRCRQRTCGIISPKMRTSETEIIKVNTSVKIRWRSVGIHSIQMQLMIIIEIRSCSRFCFSNGANILTRLFCVSLPVISRIFNFKLSIDIRPTVNPDITAAILSRNEIANIINQSWGSDMPGQLSCVISDLLLTSFSFTTYKSSEAVVTAVASNRDSTKCFFIRLLLPRISEEQASNVPIHKYYCNLPRIQNPFLGFRFTSCDQVLR